MRGLLCGSERLTLPQKRLLERVFRCRVYRWYGHPNVLSLRAKAGNPTCSISFPNMDWWSSARRTTEGLCEVIGTSFHNLAMPLIRYRTGDYVRLADPQTDGDLEFPWPAASEMAGREHEFLVSGTGRRISLTAFNMHDTILMTSMPCSCARNDRAEAEFRYVPGPEFHRSRLPTD